MEEEFDQNLSYLTLLNVIYQFFLWIFLRDMNFIALLREQTLVRDLGGLLDQVTLLSLQCERASQVNITETKFSRSNKDINLNSA